jgi:hypothetical protein
MHAFQDFENEKKMPADNQVDHRAFNKHEVQSFAELLNFQPASIHFEVFFNVIGEKSLPKKSEKVYKYNSWSI